MSGCIKGDPDSVCGGICSNDYGPTSKNACESGKDGVPVQYACPRFQLFASEMVQAAIDDGYGGAFNYGVVGHDLDTENLDAGIANSCCQCYQLVFDTPTQLSSSSLTPPKPLIVQSSSTLASGPTSFDIMMGAGGLGVFNACNEGLPQGLYNGHSQYLTYPSIGQAFDGGVHPGSDSLACSPNGSLTDALIADADCQEKVVNACDQITAAHTKVQEETRTSCIESNQADSYYHESWNVYVKRVTCPTHLTEVTGCKLEPEPGLSAPDPSVQTSVQALAAGFSSETGGQPYHTTTMQDCCMPSCAWSDYVLEPTLDGYNSFYSCGEDGTPVVADAP